MPDGKEKRSRLRTVLDSLRRMLGRNLPSHPATPTLIGWLQCGMVRKGAVAQRLPSLREILIGRFRRADGSIATIVLTLIVTIIVTFIGISAVAVHLHVRPSH